MQHHHPDDPSERHPAAAERAAASRAAALGAEDVLLFRRVVGGGWLHVGGTGRSAGWAGHVVDDEDTEPLLARASSSGATVRVLASTPTTVAGPFTAGTAALVPVADEGADVVAVWGHPRRSEALMAASDRELREVSRELLDAASAEGAGPTERLAQELLVLHAVQEVTVALDLSPEETLARVARVLLAAVGAQLALAWADGAQPQAVLGAGHPSAAHDPTAELTTADPSYAVAAEMAARDALARDERRPGEVLRCDDATRAPLEPPLSPGDGVLTYLAADLAVPGGGGLLLARTTAREREGGAESEGTAFDGIAARLTTQVARAAQALVAVALARRRTEEQLDATRLRLGQDSLTRAASRHRWEEEVARAQRLVDADVPVTVAVLDLDELKWVNDNRGHAAGDAVLQACADAVRGVLRGGSDVVARTGGDEFGVMVARATDVDALAARLRSVDGSPTPAGVPLRVSVGVAQALAGSTVEDALTRADAAMYAEKRRRRAERGQRRGEPGDRGEQRTSWGS